jgi:hypothetical protein
LEIKKNPNYKNIHVITVIHSVIADYGVNPPSSERYNEGSPYSILIVVFTESMTVLCAIKLHNVELFAKYN